MGATRPTAEEHSFGAAVARRTAQVLAGTAAWFTCFFLAVGRTDVVRAWIYVAVGLVGLVATGLIVGRRNPDVIKARAYGGRGTKAFDKVIAAFFAVFMFAVPVVAGLDAVRSSFSLREATLKWSPCPRPWRRSWPSPWGSAWLRSPRAVRMATPAGAPRRGDHS